MTRLLICRSGGQKPNADWRAAPSMPHCGKPPRRINMSDRKIRIAVLHFSHETVSFLPNETTLDD
ncbi:hypothetical protein ABTQ10_20150, partial [Acinetobacter baumannii]